MSPFRSWKGSILMRQHYRAAYFALIVFCLFLPWYSSARPIERWSYQRLFQTADLVVIAEVESSADSGETSSDNEWNQKLIGVNTEFSIKHLLKGEEGKSRLKVLHYRLDKGVSILKGPSLL